MQQLLLNFKMRAREFYVVASLREEQLAHWIADAAAPLRSCAAALAMMQGQPATEGKQALALFVDHLNQPALSASLQSLSCAREQGYLAQGCAKKVMLNLLDIANALSQHLQQV